MTTDGALRSFVVVENMAVSVVVVRIVVVTFVVVVENMAVSVDVVKIVALTFDLDYEQTYCYYYCSHCTWVNGIVWLAGYTVCWRIVVNRSLDSDQL